MPCRATILYTGNRLPSNIELGWYLTASSFPALDLHFLVKWIEFIVRSLSTYLHHWDLKGQIDFYSIIFAQAVDAVLLADKRVYRVRKVYSLLFIINLCRLSTVFITHLLPVGLYEKGYLAQVSLNKN
jgi:hypothetical protein